LKAKIILALDVDSFSKAKYFVEKLYPKVKIFAHPTARKLNEREGVELNWPEIMQFCLDNKKLIEIKAFSRLFKKEAN